MIFAGSIAPSFLAEEDCSVLPASGVVVSCANNFPEIITKKRLKTAIANDFTLLKVIPVSKFGAKIGVEGLKIERNKGNL
jgi:hypothetical protein